MTVNGVSRPRTPFRSGFARACVVLVAWTAVAALSGCDLLTNLTKPVFTPIAETLRDGGDIIVVGDFTTVMGQPRTGIVRLDSSGVVDLDFSVTVDAPINTVVPGVRGDTPVLYIGGSFTQVNGSPRYGIAAVDAATGDLITGFAPVLDDTVNGFAQVLSILPVAERNALLVAGRFDIASSTAQSTNLDLNVKALVELDRDDGTARTSFQPEIDSLSSTQQINTLAPGLGENGGWTVAVGGDFSVQSVTYYSFAVLDATGALVAFEQEAVTNSAQVRTIRSDQSTGRYLVSGNIDSPETVNFAAFTALYPIDAPAPSDVGTDLSVPSIDAGSFVVNPPNDSLLRSDGTILVGGGGGTTGLLTITAGNALVIPYTSTGALDATRYLVLGAAPYANNTAAGFTRGREWDYVYGMFPELVDPFGVGSGDTIARFDSNLGLDESFRWDFAGTLPGGTDPAAYDLIELPPGF